MPCRVVGNAIICSRGERRAKPCAYCGRPQEVLCDFPLSGSKDTRAHGRSKSQKGNEIRWLR